VEGNIFLYKRYNSSGMKNGKKSKKKFIIFALEILEDKKEINQKKIFSL
jgi:hypothetical protein